MKQTQAARNEFELKSAVSEELCVQVCQLLFRSFISSHDHSALSRGHREFDYEVRPDPSEFAGKHLAKLKRLQIWPYTVTWDRVSFRCWFGLWNPYWFSNWWGSWSNVSTPAQLVSRFNHIQQIQHHFQYFLLYSYLRIHMKSTAHRSPAFSHVHAQKFFSAAIKPPNPSVFFFSHCPARFPIWSCIVENRKRAVLKGKKFKRWTVQCKQSFRIANFNKAIK